MSVERSGGTKEVDMVKVGMEWLGTCDVELFVEDNGSVDVTLQARNASVCVCVCACVCESVSPMAWRMVQVNWQRPCKILSQF